eukprot:CAMPEP_0119069420 /NCGR_PEP_ID=MMETSP1178-20130426/19418_1 /TAXON_ID=33656 /ORGANISM="unid sp, Strain CCMP2000" /LENGTH=47 /DNA_ID= /DNA_START= /DNA_END= /DNA_ORIENTATION=
MNSKFSSKHLKPITRPAAYSSADRGGRLSGPTSAASRVWPPDGAQLP